MDDLGSGVVGAAHEVGTWRGPARRPWLRRIVVGAGFSRDWDESRLLVGGSQAGSRDEWHGDTPGVASPAAPTSDPWRLWWLPRAHEP